MDDLTGILERNSIPTGAQPWKPGEWQGLRKAAPQDEALSIAQRNAALPISEGGLGFDPMRRNEADLLGAVDYRLLPYLAGGAALGMYGIGANSRNDNK